MPQYSINPKVGKLHAEVVKAGEDLNNAITTYRDNSAKAEQAGWVQADAQSDLDFARGELIVASNSGDSNSIAAAKSTHDVKVKAVKDAAKLYHTAKKNADDAHSNVLEKRFALLNKSNYLDRANIEDSNKRHTNSSVAEHTRDSKHELKESIKILTEMVVLLTKKVDSLSSKA